MGLFHQFPGTSLNPSQVLTPRFHRKKYSNLFFGRSRCYSCFSFFLRHGLIRWGLLSLQIVGLPFKTRMEIKTDIGKEGFPVPPTSWIEVSRAVSPLVSFLCVCVMLIVHSWRQADNAYSASLGAHLSNMKDPRNWIFPSSQDGALRTAQTNPQKFAYEVEDEWRWIPGLDRKYPE